MNKTLSNPNTKKTFKAWFIDFYRYMKRDYMLYLMILPGIAYIIIFKYWPMYGVTIAFRDYSIFKGYADAPWIGLENFEKLLTKSVLFVPCAIILLSAFKSWSSVFHFRLSCL